MAEEKTQRTRVKEVENAIRYSNGDILIKGGRFSYPHAITAQKGSVGKDGKQFEDSYSTVFLLPKATHKAAMLLIRDVIKEILKEKNKGEDIKKDNWFLRDGDASGKSENKGYWTVSCRESLKRPPDVRDCRKEKMTDPKLEREMTKAADDGYVLYGGAWGNLVINPWWQNNTYGRRVNANFISCQVTPSKGRDASAFGEGNRPSEEDLGGEYQDESEDSDWTGGDDDLDTGDL